MPPPLHIAAVPGRHAVTGSVAALMALNLFAADLRDGIGPFLGVHLLGRGWGPAEIGFVNMMGGLAAMTVMLPLGFLLDATRRKRLVLAVAMLVVMAACAGVLVWTGGAAPLVARIAYGMAGAVIGPAIASVTLGLVGHEFYPRQVGRNQACHHAGHAGSALLAGVVGYAFGMAGVVALLTLLGVLALVALAGIAPREIDHAVARGLSSPNARPGDMLRTLRTTPAMLALTATVFLFHLGNAAMTPLLSQAMVARGVAGDPMAYTAATVVVAQSTMILTALLAARLVVTRGYNLVFLIALCALPLRGLSAGLIEAPWALVPVQVLDGFGNGMLGVAVPGLVARLMQGSGHVAAGLGVVLTSWAVGSALSALLGGVVAQAAGYGAAFLVLAGVAALALVVWVASTRRARMPRPAVG